MGEFADGHTSSTKVEPSRVEYWVGKTFENVESSTHFLNSFLIPWTPFYSYFLQGLGSSTPSKTQKLGENWFYLKNLSIKSICSRPTSILKHLELKKIEYRVQPSWKNSPMAGVRPSFFENLMTVITEKCCTNIMDGLNEICPKSKSYFELIQLLQSVEFCNEVFSSNFVSGLKCFWFCTKLLPAFKDKCFLLITGDHGSIPGSVAACLAKITHQIMPWLCYVGPIRPKWWSEFFKNIYSVKNIEILMINF